jgi:DNA-binding MarR family transcriptional regulator
MGPSKPGLVSLVWAAFYHTRKSVDELVRPNGVTGPQLGILNRLADQPGMSGVEIARAMLIPPQAVHR